MIAPSDDIIEEAIEQLGTISPFIRDNQRNELRSIGDTRAKSAGASGVTVDFVMGYELGLQTARVMIASSPALAVANVKPGDVL
jgi:hypothetical protein